MPVYSLSCFEVIHIHFLSTSHPSLHLRIGPLYINFEDLSLFPPLYVTAQVIYDGGNYCILKSKFIGSGVGECEYKQHCSKCLWIRRCYSKVLTATRGPPPSAAPIHSTI